MLPWPHHSDPSRGVGKGTGAGYGSCSNYEKPAQLVKELGDDNGLSQDISDQKKVVESFQVMRDRLHQWNPDVLLVIGDDQAENFLQDNLPPFCLYTGAQVDGYPFQRPAARTTCGTPTRKPGSPSSAPGSFPGTCATS